MQKHTFKPGDTLCLVPMDERHKPRSVTIDKAGRKWLAMKTGERVEIETMLTDNHGRGYRDECWPSKQAHDDHLRRKRLFSSLLEQAKSIDPPPTLLQIMTAAGTLGIKLEDGVAQ